MAGPTSGPVVSGDPGLVPELLALHQASRTAGLAEFQELAFATLHRLLRFDTAVWGLGADVVGDRAYVNSIHLHRIDPAMMVDYASARDADFIGATVAESLGRTHNFRVRDDRWSAYAAGVRHAMKWGMEHVLCTAVEEPQSRHKSFISLFRSRPDDAFTEDERRLKQELMPHLAASFIANRAWHVHGPSAPVLQSRRATALADGTGGLHDASDAFLQLLRLEWPQWRGNVLPPAIQGLIQRPGSSPIRGAQVHCEASAVGDLFLLRAWRRSSLDDLSARERTIAQHYSRGLNNREIAHLAGITPNTVRAHLAAVYRKLGVSHKQALAAMFAAAI